MIQVKDLESSRAKVISAFKSRKAETEKRETDQRLQLEKEEMERERAAALKELQQMDNAKAHVTGETLYCMSARTVVPPPPLPPTATGGRSSSSSSAGFGSGTVAGGLADTDTDRDRDVDIGEFGFPPLEQVKVL